MRGPGSFYEENGGRFKGQYHMTKSQEDEYIKGVKEEIERGPQNPVHSAHSLTINYRNYRGEIATRTIHPIGVWFGVGEYHIPQGPQWFLKAYDPTKGADRDFAINDIVGVDRIDEGYEDAQRDMLPVGHLVMEQAENIGGTVTQTVRRPNGSEYERVVDADEAYGKFSREQTMVLDTEGRMICVGDIVRCPVEEPFQELHGTWGEYVVEKTPGGYRLGYFRAEKGQTLPRGYSAGYMSEHIMEQEGRGFKDMLFSLKPLRSRTLKIVGQDKPNGQQQD